MLHESSAGPILIGGAGRSGTSLLRVMLDSHPHICCGPEIKVLPEIARLWQTLCGPLTDVMTAYGNSPEEVTRLVREFIEGLVANFRRASGKPRWGEKTPHSVLHMASLGKILPDAKFIHVIRDGRDVACSLVTMPWLDSRTGEKTEYVQNVGNAARYWKNVVQTARKQARAKWLRSRVLEVRYEDLVHETRSTMRGVLDFVCEPWDERILSHHVQRHAHVDGESSTHQIKQAVYPQAIGRWQNELTGPDKAAFRREAGVLLQELGYAPADW